VPAGDRLTERERVAIQRAAELAGAGTGLRFAVCLDTAEGNVRAYARSLHAGLLDSSNTVLIFVDPSARALEIVTGIAAGRLIDARASTLASLAMTSKFSLGDLAGGVVDGLQMLAESGRRPPVLHTSTP
jgi:uncharacterized membrane protein YgcG